MRINIIDAILLALPVIAILYTLSIGIAKTERHECIKWQEDAEEYKDKGWYATDWQKAQCAAYQIEL